LYLNARTFSKSPLESPQRKRKGSWETIKIHENVTSIENGTFTTRQQQDEEKFINISNETDDKEEE
jgi:hypothetical protein